MRNVIIVIILGTVAKIVTILIALFFPFQTARDKSDNKKLFGFSFARLMELEGAILPVSSFLFHPSVEEANLSFFLFFFVFFVFFQDGLHDLYVYRFDEKIKLDPDLYLMLPSNLRDLENGYKFEYNPVFTCSHKESFYVHTLLCSTKLTQNGKFLSRTLFPRRSRA